MWKQADQRTFDNLFNAFARPLTLYAMQFLRDLDAAEDVVQDVFLYLYERHELHPAHMHRDHYLYSLVRNRCLNRLAYQKRRARDPADPDELRNEKGENPSDLVEAIEFEHCYLEAIESLSPRCRQVFELSRHQGKNNQEIADELGISKRTVETLISKVLKILRKRLRRFLLNVILFLAGILLFWRTCDSLCICLL